MTFKAPFPPHRHRQLALSTAVGAALCAVWGVAGLRAQPQQQVARATERADGREPLLAEDLATRVAQLLAVLVIGSDAEDGLDELVAAHADQAARAGK